MIAMSTSDSTSVIPRQMQLRGIIFSLSEYGIDGEQSGRTKYENEFLLSPARRTE